MSETITKTALIESLSQKTGLSATKTGEVVNELLATIQTSVANGDTVNITGFGSFSGKSRAAREGRNPKTGEPIKIAASVVPTFKAGTGFKAAVAK